ncbi:type VI lipase adapter Tla3 domain-containing protein [Pseudomonas fragariae (ex Marin et al. 2024)]|uniref:type VI lipase adapter Tla3 domain-containing protein n=1 Tax=Pseudomonas fragariae (ex Marin et al. 2024) TaxID=3080056 RepID=UPI003F7A72AE
MSAPLKKKSLRPKLKAYLWIIGILLVLWLGFVFLVYLKAQETNMELRDINSVTRWGIAGILGAVLLAYSGHWWGNAVAHEKTELAAYKSNVAAQVSEQQATQKRTSALEIRGVGIAVGGWHQSSIWRKVQEKRNNFISIYSQNPEDYTDSLLSRENTQKINTRAAFKHSAGESVSYWPIPTFALGPPNPYEKPYRAADLINFGRNQATLGVTQLLWQNDENTSQAQSMIERLFQFFEDNQKVPQALIASEDGDVTRDIYRNRGTPGLQNAQVVPTVFESMTGLLITRSDRVDRYVRPYATNDAEDNQNKDTDLGKLWAFYWEQPRKFRKVYEDAQKTKGIKDPLGPGTISTTYWQSQLPTLWKTTNNRGPGNFEPSPWLPIRWNQHQVKEFDAAPVLGYLHRPIKAPMQDENGKRLKPALQAKALQAAWVQALDTLPDGQKPVRVFYDSTNNPEAEIALNNALHDLNKDGHGLELGNVEEGYDIGRRLGNTGVSGALVEINLATIASYKDGGVSAVVYAGTDGSLTVQMVRPPDEARKAKNSQNRGADPFTFGSPTGGAPAE